MDHQGQEYYEGLVGALRDLKRRRPKAERENWDDLIEPVHALLEVSRWDQDELAARFRLAARMRDDEDAEGASVLDEVQAALTRLGAVRQEI